ncbi:hypothetical protein DL96DRAFT_1709520 [Flagelloscypha sp. PMI_526]|nr:hypothetical protein DL96DRAFT_1709520 [Flagelloscypha sp. PMI_526]
MSSTEDDADTHTDQAPKAKKRRLPRACDACRKKKTKCKRGANKELLQALEKKVAAYEALLQKASITFIELRKIEEYQQTASADTPASSHATSSSPPPSKPVPATMGPSDPLSYLAETSTPGQGGEEVDEKLVELNNVDQRMRDMHIETVKTRWFGSSSNFSLFSQAAEMKESYEGGRSSNMSSGQFKRPQYWKLAPHEEAMRHSDPGKPLQFPPQELLDHLVSMYLLRINSFFPFLHAPTFRKSIQDQLYLHDQSFGRLVSMVCAVGSRFSDDPRIYYDPQNPVSAGFHWFEQVRILQSKYLLETMSLLEVQTLCVALLFFLGTSMPQGTWFTLGFAIRTCQERGSLVLESIIVFLEVREEEQKHSKMNYGNEPGGNLPTLRVFVGSAQRIPRFLVTVDRQLTTFLGRPSAISSEDIEIDYPEECDDEYWELNGDDVTFHQPPEKPSLVTAFCVHLKLCELYAVSMRTLYASPRSRALFGVTGDNWESRIVTELDSSLNSWLDSIPDHLRWDPHREDPIYFDQSCLLYSIYYGLQITIHRPFINKKQSVLAFPSLAICTNSARSCSHVLEAQSRRGSMRIPHAQMTAYSSALMLLMNIYGAKKFEISLDAGREMSAVYMLIRFLKTCDNRWNLAGRFADVITEMASVHVPLPQPAETTLKRGRDDDQEEQQSHQVIDIGYTSQPYPSGMVGYSDPSYNWNYGQQPQPAAPSQLDYHASPYNHSASPIPQQLSYSSGAADWNINPYAFPSLPTGAYPGFYVDPNMAHTDFGLQELERLSHQMSGGHANFSSMPASMAGPEWQQFLGGMATSPHHHA